MKKERYTQINEAKKNVREEQQERKRHPQAEA